MKLGKIPGIRSMVPISKKWMRKNNISFIDDYGIIWDTDSSGSTYWCYKFRLVGRRPLKASLLGKPKKVVIGRIDESLIMRAENPEAFIIREAEKAAKGLIYA